MRALLLLTVAALLRLARRGMVVRALLWPGVLTALSLLGAVAASGLLLAPPRIAAADPALVVALEAAGLEVIADPDPATAVAADRAPRAAWREGQQVVLMIDARQTLVGGGLDNLRAEAALRDMAGAAWRIAPSHPPIRSDDLSRSVGWMAGLVGVLFTLYGAVLGLGGLAQDRASGVLEAERALPVPPWMHPAARLLASGLALSGALAVTLLLLDAIIGLTGLGMWWLHGSSAAVAAAGIGAGALAGGRGISAALSAALMLCTALLVLGAALPGLGGALPIAGLGALASGAAPQWSGLVLSGLVAAGGGGWFARGLR